MQVLIINAGCRHFGSGGTLNAAFADIACRVLGELGHETTRTDLDAGWDIEEEVRKVLAADAIIVQTPGWWMSTPWQLKKYEDEVFVQPGISNGDGRTRSDPSKRYGTGGRLVEKCYMLSSTWNAPREAFDDPEQFFGGVGIDGVFLPLHKTFEFIGMKPLPTFMANDVFKNPTIEADFKRFEAHLRAVFG